MAVAKQESTNDKKKTTTSTTKTTSQTVSVGGRDVKVSQPKQTTSKATTPSTVSNVSVGGRSLSNTQKNDTTAAKKVSTAINNNAATINSATKKVEQANKSFAESQSKSIAQVGKENQDWQIQQRQERLNRVADRTREEAQALQNQKDAAREQRVAEDPTYAYNFYEFSNGANTIGGSEYVGRVNTNNQQFKNLYDSFQLLEDQYRRDGDYRRYANGFEELSKKYDQLMAEADELNTYKADYNNSVQKQYQSNRDRMRELTRTMANIKKMGGSRAELDALNEEYLALKNETDQLKLLNDDIESLKENDYYEWLKENGEEKDIRDYESYLASEDDNGLGGFIKNRAKALSANMLAAPYAVTSLADISRDLLGDMAGDLMDSVAVSLQEKGFIDDESFKKVMEVSEQLKAFEYDNDNNLSQILRDYRQRVNAEINAGDKSDFELIAGEMIDSALENYIRYQTLGTVGTYAMALTTFGESYQEYKAKGYSNAVSALCSGMKGYITWWSENLSTERYFKVLGSSAGSSIDKMFFSMLAQNMMSMVPEEGLEEGVEYAADYAVDALANFLQPGIDTPEFKMGDLLKGSLIAMGSTMMSATAGAFTGAMMYENDVPVIANGKDFAQFNVETEYLKTVQKEEADIDVKMALGEYIAKCERRIAEYKEISPTAGAVTLSTDNANMATQQEADSTYKQAMVPEAVADSNEQEKTDIEVMEASEYVRAITQSYLAQNGIGISVEEYVNADEKTRQGYKKGTDILKKSKVKYGIARMFNGQNGVQIGDRVILNSDQSRTISFKALADLDDKTYNEAMKFDKNGIAKDTNTIFSKAGGDPAVETSAIHELLHYAERSGLYKKIKEMVLNMAGEDRFNTAAKRIGDIYKGRKIDADAEREAMAFFIQENIRSKEFAKQLASVNGSAFNRLYKNLTSALSGDDKAKLENIMANAIRNAKGEMERETRRLLRERKSGYVGENYISPDMAQMSVAEYDASGRDILKTYLKNSDLSEESQNELLDRMEEAYNVMTTFMETGEFPEFSKWQDTTYSIDREGNFSVVVTNGDYEMNIDFSTVCKKRKMMDKVLNELSRNGYLNTALTQNQVTQLRQIIQNHGLEVACGLCFVDAKRFNQGNWAGRFETKWNKLIDQVAGLAGLDEDAEISTFGITTGYEASPTLADINFSDPVFQSFVELSKGKTEEALMARAIINNPDLRGYVSTESLYGSEGFEQLKANKPKLYDLVNNSGGSSKPKLAHTEILYMNEIVNNDIFKAEDAKEVGGVRVQSFSDFMTNMVFDYVQMFGDMEAKGLTGHSYTKVKEYAILFGKSGMKINLSIIPAGFDSRKYTAADIRELRKNNRKEWNKLRENAGLDEDGNYMFDQESFDWDLALEIQNLEGYDKNVGTICVGVSDKHIFKMLDDDNVCMIIPYHRSGINPEVALAMGINVFNDYTKKQNTCFKNAKGNRGRKVGIDFNWYTGFTMDDGTHFKGMIENDYDARATEDEYLRWCEANDYVPKFDAFMDHPNYYKLLIDYRAYDKAGNVAPQNPIKISGDGMNMMPTYIDAAANPKLAEIYGNDIGFVNVLQKSLNTYELAEETQNEMLSPITEDVVEQLGLKKNTEIPKGQFSIGSYKAVERLVESDDPVLQERGRNLLHEQVKAREMESEGYDMEEIWEKTGWIKKADGKWRFQFYDGAEETIENIAKWIHIFGNGNPDMLNGKSSYIDDLINADNVIFTMYPEIKNLIVKFSKEANTNEYGHYGKNSITINLSPYGTKIDEDDVEKIANTFFHELQHAIQEIEGLEGGSNLAIAAEEYMTEVGEELIKEHSKLVEKLYNSGIKDVKAAIEDYQANRLTKTFEHNFTKKQLGILRDIRNIIFRVENIGLYADTQEAFDRYWNNLGEKEAREEAENALLDEDIRSWVSPDTEGYLKSEAVKKRYNISNSEQYSLGEETPLGETEMSDEQMNLKSRVPNAKDLSEQKTARVLENQPKQKTKFKDVSPGAFTEAKNKIVSKYAAVEELAEKTKNKKLVPLVDEVMRANAMANTAIYDGMVDKNTGKIIGKSLTEILGKIPKENRHLFDEYLYHYRNVDEMSMYDRFAKTEVESINKQLKDLKKKTDKGSKKKVRELEKRRRELKKIENRPVFGKDVTAEDSMDKITEIEKAHPEFKETAEEMWELNRQYLKMRQDSGIISEDTYKDFIEKRPHYVPISRDIDNTIGVSNANPNDIKKFKGSTRDIKSVEDTMKKHIQKTYRVTSMNELNSEIIKAYGGGENVESDNLIDLIEEGFNPAEENPNGKQISAYANGQKISIPVSKEMYEAIASQKVDDSNLKKVADMTVAKLSKWRKALLTSKNPIFSLFTNPMRDIQDAFGQTKYRGILGEKYGAYLVKAANEIRTNGEYSKMYDRLGIRQSQYIGKEIADAYDSMLKNKGAKKFINGLFEMGENIEKIPRLAEFMASLDAGNSVQQAAHDAADVTTDFKRGGTAVKTLDKYGFPFLSASVAGFDKQVRNAKGDFKGIRENGIKGVISMLARLTLAAGIPLRVLQDWLWKDDDDYKQLSDYIKSRYYIVPDLFDIDTDENGKKRFRLSGNHNDWKTEGGRFIRIPKGRVAAFYQTVLDGAYKAVKKQTDVWNMLLDDWKSFADNVAPNSVADSFIGSPLIQAFGSKYGKTWYGEDIVPLRLQGDMASEQYDESTDLLSIKIGELSRQIADKTKNDKFQLSPYKVHYVLDQYSGILGDVVLPALTLQTEVGVDNPILKGAATAIVDKFTTDPILKNQNVSTFYDLMDALKTKSSSKYAEPEQILSYKYLSSVATEMSKLYSKKRDIQGSRELTNKEKVEQTRKIQQEINVFAKAGLANYDNIDMVGKYAAVGGVQYYQREDGSWRKTRKETLEKMNNADLSMEDRNHYFETSEKISDIRDEIKNNTPKGERADYGKQTIDAINSSKLSAKGKNALYDSYYSSKATDHINKMNLSDQQKYDLKVAHQLAEGKKDKNGKTISNSKAEATAEAYDKLGLLDDVLKYIKDNDIAPSELGLSKTVYNKLIKGYKGSSSKSSPSKKTSSKKAKTSSGGGGGSGIRSAGRLNKLGPVTSKSLIDDKKIANGATNYMKAYASVFNRSGKKLNTGGRAASVTCPRCGSQVSSSNGKCPVCGANL